MNRDWRLGWLCALSAMSVVGQAAADSPQVYRCGSEYTNQPDPLRQCTLLRNASITLIEGTQVQPAAPQASALAPVANESKVDGVQQRQRDAQARLVLQAEWQRAQASHQALLQAWNHGEPERRADEHRQPGKYQERVAQLRMALERSQADLAGLQRELSRLPVMPPGGAP